MANKRVYKVKRILTIYLKLAHGVVINKKELAELFNVNEKIIQRDLEDVIACFSDNRDSIGSKDIVYRLEKKGHVFDNRDDTLTMEYILVIIKVLLESRAISKSELIHLTYIKNDGVEVVRVKNKLQLFFQNIILINCIF